MAELQIEIGWLVLFFPVGSERRAQLGLGGSQGDRRSWESGGAVNVGSLVGLLVKGRISDSADDRGRGKILAPQFQRCVHRETAFGPLSQSDIN